MILIDAHVHISSPNYRTDDVLRTLKRVDTDSALIFPDAESTQLESENRYVLRSGQEFDCYPFYYIGGNPFTDTRSDLEVPHNLGEYSGVRWHHWFGESPDRTGRVDRHELEFAVVTMESPEFEALTSALRFYDKPIMFEEDFAVTLEFIARYGDLKVIIPHMGLLSGGEENVIGRLYTNANVYFTTSHGTLDPVTLRRVGPERLLYSSDYPYGDPVENIEKIKRLDLGDEDEAMVFGENAERLLNREVGDLNEADL